MPGLSQSMTALSAGLLWAQSSGPASVTSLPFSPLKVTLLLGWVYASLYLVKRVEDSPLVPDKYRRIIYVVTLFFGPLVFLVLLLLEGQQSGREGTYFTRLLQRIKDVATRMRRRGPQVQEEDTTLRLFDSMGAEASELYGHSDSRGGDRHTLDMTVQIIDDALKQRASDILIDPKDQNSYAVRLRVDGTLRTVRELTSDACKAVINSVKAVSSLDIAERRRPQDGAFTAQKGRAHVSFRVATAGALYGEKLSIRVLNTNADKFTLVDAGVPERQRNVITEAISKPSGMVLICGPTGSGKTTTLYSMLNLIDRHTHNVITVEDPIEAHLPEASQLEINPKADITFAKALRSILRQDPDVICVGEIRDEETAEIALRAAQTGHLVLATIHCDSNATALVRLLDLGVSPLLMSSGLTLLLTQRLMRKLCPDCKKPATLSPALVQEFKQKGIDTRNIFEPGTCERCSGTGYYGRTAICDLLPVTEELRTEIAQNAQISDKLRTEGEKKGRTNLKSEAIARVIAGLTSLEELKRVVG